jgi:ring-1,2-phenylacetyl-CoA epoxidase subunit PaaE
VPGGLFSTYATERLKAGDRLDVMPPQGRFTLDPAPEVARHVLCIAAGSGITPVLSILKSLLALEPLSRATLVYGNRTSATAMFVEEIEGLKNRFLGRFQVLHVLSREPQDVPLLSGRIDAAKLAALAAGAVDFASADAVYACGPDGMLRAVEDNIPLFGVSREKIHIERFGTAASRGPRTPAAAIVAEKPLASVFVTLDGRRHVFDMRESDGSLIDAAARSGLELPYSCKGGMCCTCRCRIEAGAATMAVNYSLEPWEIEKGFTLACQARPVTPELALDFDTL